MHVAPVPTTLKQAQALLPPQRGMMPLQTYGVIPPTQVVGATGSLDVGVMVVMVVLDVVMLDVMVVCALKVIVSAAVFGL